MKPTRIVRVAAATTLLAGALAGGALFGSRERGASAEAAAGSDTEGKPKNARPPPRAAAPDVQLIPVPVPGLPAQELDRRISDLQHEVASLRAETEQLTSKAPESPPLSEEEEAAILEDAVYQEVRDGAWETESARRLEAFLARPEQAGSTLLSLDCGTTLCRAALRHEDLHTRARFLERFSDLVPPAAEGYASVEGDEDLDIEVYFSREGALPLAAR